MKAALAQFSELDVVYAGIGALSTNPVFERQGGVLPDGEFEELVAAGVVGDVAMRFFDAEGDPVKTSLDARTIGITLEELQQVPRVVGVAGGPQKASAILGALRGGLINVLTTDYATAAQLSAGCTVPGLSALRRR